MDQPRTRSGNQPRPGPRQCPPEEAYASTPRPVRACVPLPPRWFVPALPRGSEFALGPVCAPWCRASPAAISAPPLLPRHLRLGLGVHPRPPSARVHGRAHARADYATSVHAPRPPPARDRSHASPVMHALRPCPCWPHRAPTALHVVPPPPFCATPVSSSAAPPILATPRLCQHPEPVRASFPPPSSGSVPMPSRRDLLQHLEMVRACTPESPGLRPQGGPGVRPQGGPSLPTGRSARRGPERAPRPSLRRLRCHTASASVRARAPLLPACARPRSHPHLLLTMAPPAASRTRPSSHRDTAAPLDHLRVALLDRLRACIVDRLRPAPMAAPHHTGSTRPALMPADLYVCPRPPPTHAHGHAHRQCAHSA